MKYKVVRIVDVDDAIHRNTVKNARGRAIEIDKLIKELQAMETFTLVDVSPNLLTEAISGIERYLQNGGCSFVGTLNDVAGAILISRPTLNEWDNAGIISIEKRMAATKQEKTMLKQKRSGYDIADLLAQLKKYVENSSEL